MNNTKTELLGAHFNRASLHKIKYLYVCVGSQPTPKASGNARVIASWPTKQVSSLTGIGRLFPGPRQSYRVW